jgi:hypothetical protein
MPENEDELAGTRPVLAARNWRFCNYYILDSFPAFSVIAGLIRAYL